MQPQIRIRFRQQDLNERQTGRHVRMRQHEVVHLILYILSQFFLHLVNIASIYKINDIILF
jgi:hypothetical protein